jgi:DNA-binding protein Fis
MGVDSPFFIEKIIEDATRAALKHTNGNRTEAALLMGISVRTLRNWIHKYSLAKEFPLQPHQRGR